MCGEGFGASSLLLSLSRLDFSKLSAALTLNLPTCRDTAVLQCKQSVSLSAGHLRYFQRWWKNLEQTRCQLEKNKVPSEVRKHTASLSCSVVKLVYSISLTSQTQAATVDPLSVDEERTRWTTQNKKETAYSFMALSCVDLMFLSPCVYVCLSVCVHASATKQKMKQPMRRKECLVPHHALVSLSNLWQSAQSQGLKDTRCRGKGSRGWGKDQYCTVKQEVWAIYSPLIWWCWRNTSLGY